MKVSAREILGFDTISKGNNGPWNTLIDYLEKLNTPDIVEFDFRGIEITEPYKSDSFRKLMAIPNFRMILHNSKDTAESIKLANFLACVDTDKVQNIDDVLPTVVDKVELRIQARAKDLMPYFVIDGNKAVLEIYKRYEQMGDPNTVKYIARAIQNVLDEYPSVDEFVIATERIAIQPSIYNYIATTMTDIMKASNCDIRISSNDVTTQNKIDIAFDVAKAHYTIEDKIAIMRNTLVANRVGIFTKYKEGRAKDEFGRYGHGEKVSVRVAIFRGFKERDGETCACFTTFHSAKFYTREHWYLEHDNEVMKELPFDNIVVPVSELGIYDSFIGSKFHFSNPVQYKKEGTTVMFSLTPTGGVDKHLVTIPERIKMVFDDFDIEYEHEYLERCIAHTKDLLKSV